jgi:O-antigen/teichoic acid export membrane protein
MDKLKESGIKILRFTEKYTKTDMVYLARGGFWLGIGQIASSGASFLLSIAFANLLTPDSYGIYKYVISIGSLLLITTLSGMDTAVTQSVAKKFEGTVMAGLIEKMKWGFIGSTIALGFSTYYYLQSNTNLCIAFLIVSIFLPFTESLDIYNSLLQGKKLFKTFTVFNSITQIVSTISLIITLIITKNILVIILVYFLSNTLLNGIFLLLSMTSYKSNDLVDENAIIYGKKLSGLFIVSLITNELDKLLVFHYLGASTLAVYTIAMAPTDQLKGLLKNVQFLIIPKLAENIHKDIKKEFLKKIFIFGCITTAFVICYILFSPIVFKIAFPKYPESIFYSQLISISIIAAITAQMIYSYLEVKQSTKHLTYFYVWSNVINISFLFFGIYFYGLIGIVIARIMSRFSVLHLTLYLTKKA